MKVVINTCYGGFGLSDKAKKLYKELFNQEVAESNRGDPRLVQVVEQLGAEAIGHYADLKIVEIPDDVDWVIEDYDGREWVAEVHRTWS